MARTSAARSKKTAAATSSTVRRSRRLSGLAATPAANPFSAHAFATNTFSVAPGTAVGGRAAQGRKRKLSIKAEGGKRSRLRTEEGKGQGQGKGKGKGIGTSTGSRVTSTANANRKGRSKSKQKATVKRKAPKDWRKAYDMICELRADRTAPVDTLGAEALAEPGITQADREYQTLVALMLSSQTKDQVVGACMRRLQAHGLSLDNILDNTSDAELHALLLGPPAVGFHNNKTKFIRQASERIRTEHGGRVPGTLEGLCALPGVGPKMAIIVLEVAFDIPDAGIAIDTHLHRMCNILRWVDAKSPEQTRRQLESWLPVGLWGEINLVWVGLGQEMQQEKAKVLRKCLACSNPGFAFRLMKRLGLDLKRVAEKEGVEIDKGLLK